MTAQRFSPMDSILGIPLRANSAISASTSYASLQIAKSTSVLNSQVGRRPSFSFTNEGSKLAKVTASVQEISKVSDSKINGTKVESSIVGACAMEVATDVLNVERKTIIDKTAVPNTSLNAVVMAIASVALAAEKQRRHEELASKTEVRVDSSRQGRLVESGRVYRQTFVIRSYEVGANRTASIETLMNHFQEAALNHVFMSGLAGDGFGATNEMTRINLIWVVTRMQVQVERYPEWGDVVEIDTWVTSSGKNGMRRDWLLRDYKTGQIMARATSTWVMMNKTTRKLSKMPDVVRKEIAPHFLQRSALMEKNVHKIIKLDDSAEYIRSGLAPRHGDLDMNLHVNNVKYIGWILESLPASILEGHDLITLTLEYRRECGQSDVVQSITSREPLSSSTNEGPSDAPFSHHSAGSAVALTPEITEPRSSIGHLQFTHLLRLEADGAEIVRGRTIWRLKQQ